MNFNYKIILIIKSIEDPKSNMFIRDFQHRLLFSFCSKSRRLCPKEGQREFKKKKYMN